MGIGTILLMLAAAGLVLGYAMRDKLKGKTLEWLTADPVKGAIIYTLSESTTVAFEEVRKKLQKKHPHFELVRVKINAGNERLTLDHNSMSREELLRCGEDGRGIYGRLFFFTVSFKAANEMSEETLKCRVESNRPGVWKAAYVEIVGVNSQTGHPQKAEGSATPAPQTTPAVKVPVVELDDVPSVEDVAKEGGAPLLAIAGQEPVQTPAPPTAKKTSEKPRSPRRQRSANAIGAMSEI